MTDKRNSPEDIIRRVLAGEWVPELGTGELEHLLTYAESDAVRTSVDNHKLRQIVAAAHREERERYMAWLGKTRGYMAWRRKNKLSHVGPPSAAKYLLYLIPPKYRECTIGDLEEEYRTAVLPQYGRTKATVWYWTQVLLSLAALLGPFLLRLAGLDIVRRFIKK